MMKYVVYVSRKAVQVYWMKWDSKKAWGLFRMWSLVSSQNMYSTFQRQPNEENWKINIISLFFEMILLRFVAYCIYKFRLRKLNKNSIIWAASTLWTIAVNFNTKTWRDNGAILKEEKNTFDTIDAG